MANKHIKDAQHHSLLEKCKSKLQWTITLYLSEWPTSKTPQTSAGESVEKREPSCTAGGMQTDTAIMEDSMEFP